MQDLEKRIENIEKILKIEGSTNLTRNETIVCEFVLKYLYDLFEIRKYDKNNYEISTMGWRYAIFKDTSGLKKGPEEDVLEAFLSIGIKFFEIKEYKE